MKKQNSEETKLKNIINRYASELVGNVSIVEIHSDYELIISGCRGIIDYDATNIVADAISGIIRISGRCLKLDVFQSDVLTVSGKIQSVCFEKNYD